MTPTDFREACKRLGLSTGAQAATLLGVTLRAVRHYEAGTRAIPEPVSRLLRLLIVARITPDRALRYLRHERDAREARP